MDSNDTPADPNSNSLQSDKIICNGCKLTLEENGMASDSVVVSFGNSLWHVDCFRCAKCRNLVEHDTNLLLLSDGSPVCENCSYICSVCKNPISNEAIVTGEESYHADCFRCRSCSNRIEELIFAKTSQGIYCMTCHNERVTRSRRHAESKRNKASSHSSSKQKDRENRDKDRNASSGSRSKPKLPVSPGPQHSPQSTPQFATLQSSATDPSLSINSSHPSHHQASNSISNVPSLSHPKLPLSSLPHTSHPSQLSFESKPNPSFAHPYSHKSKSPSSADVTIGQSNPSRSSQSNANFLGFRRRGGSTSSVQHPPSHPPIGLRMNQAPSLDPANSHPSTSAAAAITRPSTADGAHSLSSSPHPSQFASPAINRSYESSPHLHTIPDPSNVNVSAAQQKSTHPFQTQKSKLLDSKSDTSAFQSKLKHRSASLDSFSNFQPLPPTNQSQFDLDSESHRSATTSENPMFSYNDIFSSLDHNPSPPLMSASYLDDPQRSKNQYNLDSLLPAHTTQPPRDRRAEHGETPIHGGTGNSDLPDSGFDVALVEKVLGELDETKRKMKILQEEYLRAGTTSPNSHEGSSYFATKQTSLKREEARSKMRELKMKMFEQISKLKGPDSLENQSEELKQAISGLQNQLRQLAIERDFRVTEIEAISGITDQVRKDGKISQTVDQVLGAKFHQVRDQYLGEIQELAGERDRLKEEVSHLRKIQESQAKELDSLNHRYDALSEMNAVAVKRLEETRNTSTRIQGRAVAPPTAKQTVNSPTTVATLPTHESELAPEVNIATTRKFKWGKSHAQKTSATPTTVRNNQSQNSGSISGGGPDSTPNNSVLNISNNNYLGLQSANSNSHLINNNMSNNSVANNNSSSNLINSHSSPGVPAGSHHPGNSNHGSVGGGGNHTGASSLSSAQQQPINNNKVSNTNNNSNNINSSNNNNGSTISITSSIAGMRPHTFQPVSALRPVRCDYCGDKLWGLAEVRCTSCGSYSHTKCAANFFGCQASSGTPTNSNHTGGSSMGAGALASGGLVSGEEEVESVLFGNDLVLQARLENKLVPSVVIKCIEAVERHGLKFEGIYRKTGGMSSVKMIQNCFEKGTTMNFNDLDKFNDISAITSTLKNYFRQLPNPLFTFELHEAFVTVATMAQDAIRLEALERVIHQLPAAHFETLKVLMAHLSNIEKLSEYNKMNSQNLGVIFGPTLMRSSNPNRQFSDMPFTAKIVELTVLNKFQLFRKPYGSSAPPSSSTNPNLNQLLQQAPPPNSLPHLPAFSAGANHDHLGTHSLSASTNSASPPHYQPLEFGSSQTLNPSPSTT